MSDSPQRSVEAAQSTDEKNLGIVEYDVPRVSRPKLILFAIGAFVAVFAASYSAVVPASFFVQAARPWGVSVSSLWMIAAYLIGYLSFILPASRISEYTGRLAAFWFGLIMFTVFAGVAGHASTARTFDILRAFQGVGAGFMTSISHLVLASNTSAKSRSMFIGGLVAAQLFGAGSAHTIGGALAAEGKFRWGIYLGAPLMAAPALLCTPALIADKKPTRTETVANRVAHYDYIGTFILIGTVVMLTLGTVFGGNEHPWGSAMVICLLVFGAVGIAVFLVYEKLVAKRPLMDNQWLHVRNLQISIIGILFISMTVYALAVYIPIMYMTVRQLPTNKAGRMSAPYWGTSMGAALLSGLVLRYQPKAARPLIWVGLTIGTIFAGLYYTFTVHGDITKERAFLALAGAGVGLAFPAITYIAQICVAADEAGFAAVMGHFLSIIG
ncbi:hypothetical protein EC988_004880, partial [Linderina pennispora]